MNSPPSPSVRPAGPADLPDVQRIYAHHVRTGTGTFEEVPPDLAEIEARWRAVTGGGLPWLVAERGGAVAGFAYASAHNARSAYRYSVQDSVYVSPDAVGQGIGRALMEELVARCTELGYRQMVALVGGGGNAGSLGLHGALGFRRVGVLESIGFKFGRWQDVVLMQRALGDGDGDIPSGPAPAAPVAVR